MGRSRWWRRRQHTRNAGRRNFLVIVVAAAAAAAVYLSLSLLWGEGGGRSLWCWKWSSISQCQLKRTSKHRDMRRTRTQNNKKPKTKSNWSRPVVYLFIYLFLHQTNWNDRTFSHLIESKLVQNGPMFVMLFDSIRSPSNHHHAMRMNHILHDVVRQRLSSLLSLIKIHRPDAVDAESIWSSN